MFEVRQAVHHDFQRNRHLLFDLFGGAAGPLRDDVHVVVGHVRISLDGQRAEGQDAPREQHARQAQNEEPLAERKIDESLNHYWSTVFCRTSASRTTRAPGARPETISCWFSASIFPPTTPTRRKRPPSAGM